MTTETTSYGFTPEISHSALLGAAQLAESYTRVGRFHQDEDIEMIRLRIVEARLCFEAASPTLLVASLIDALFDKELAIGDLQAQVDKLRAEGSDNE